MINFACISPHPPLLLPSIGSPEDRAKVKKTTASLKALGGELKKIKPRLVVVSSPHPDWGFDVPLHFLAGGLLGADIKTYLTDNAPTADHYEAGKALYDADLAKITGAIALVASGDLSHRLKEDGPYGYHEQGPAFDKTLIDSLKNKDIKTIIGLDERFKEAGECGLRSFCFMLGILDAAMIDWRVNILSYEGPFGVGYLVAGFDLPQNK